MDLLAEITALSAASLLGFYDAAVVTEIFLQNGGDSPDNVLIRVVFRENGPPDAQIHYIGDRIRLKNKMFVGIRQYEMTIAEALLQFASLTNLNQWVGPDSGKAGLQALLPMQKQFVPAGKQIRLNAILSTGFQGNYVYEFFDTNKSGAAALYAIHSLQQLNLISSEIKKRTGINLALCRDRIGNIIFQLPITVMKWQVSGSTQGDGVNISFLWHEKVEEIPPGLIEASAIYDRVCMGACAIPYNQSVFQEIKIGTTEIDSSIHIYQKWMDSYLMIGMMNCGCGRLTALRIGSKSDDAPKRQFKIDESIIEIDVTPMGLQQSVDYTEHINAGVYNASREQLFNDYSFRQYTHNQRQSALNDIREILNRNVDGAAYLWDPFLRARDILETLLYCYDSNARLKAIGSITYTTKKVYDQQGKSSTDIITGEQTILQNAIVVSGGLDLEFRMQYGNYGHSFHDSFLLFPGSQIRKPKVYSLGISINSIGNDHHIIQEVSHPQNVIDAFNELWLQLDKKECVVWGQVY